VTRSEEPRSALSVGIGWASRVTTLGLEFVIPPLLGVLADRWWGTSPLALLVGAVLGFALGMLSILRLAREGTRGNGKAAPGPPGRED
jgi:ATP synthase protein I